MKGIVVKWFAQHYPDLYNQMKVCNHDHSNGGQNPFHLENDVLSHTMMVLDLAKNDINHIFAAVLHDLGKLYTRYEKDNGRVSFRDHENASMFKSIDILNHAKTEFDIDVLMILKMVAWHGTLWNKTPVPEKLKMIDACYGNQPEFLKELIEFVQADAYGREFCEQIQESEVAFLDSQFDHLNVYIPFNTKEFRPKRKLDAVFLVGVSGSGKSTYLEQNPVDDCQVISVDNHLSARKMNYDSIDYDRHIKKAYDSSMKDLLDAVNARQNIVVDMTNLSKQTRSNKLVKIPTTQYNHKAVIFLKGEKVTFDNLKKRDHKQLSPEIIARQIVQFELPNYDEFDEIEYVFSN